VFRFFVFFLDLIFVIRILVLLLGPHVDRGPKSPNLIFQWKSFWHPTQFQKEKLKMNYIFNCQKLEKNAKNFEIIMFHS